MGTWFAPGEITALLRNYVKTHKLGRVLSADTGFRLGDDTVRAPDVAFVRQERNQRRAKVLRRRPGPCRENFSPYDSVRQLSAR